MLHSVLLLLAAPAAEPVQWAQMTIERRVIIRVPMARKGRAPARITEKAADAWDEKKGPRCVALRSIRAAAIAVRQAASQAASHLPQAPPTLPRSCHLIPGNSFGGGRGSGKCGNAGENGVSGDAMS